MKRLQFGLLLFALCFGTQAWAGVTIPGLSGSLGWGGSYTVGDFDWVASKVVQEDPECGGGTVHCANNQGSLLSAVYRDDASGNLLFMWQIINTSTGPGATSFIDAVTWRFYPPAIASTNLAMGIYNSTSSIGTDPLYSDLVTNTGAAALPLPGDGGANPTLFWNGLQIFAFFESPANAVFCKVLPVTCTSAIAPGNHSNVWWAYTDAKNYTSGNLLLDQLNGVGIADITGAGDGLVMVSYEPAPAIPEPASLFLMGSGLVGLAGAMRRKLAK